MAGRNRYDWEAIARDYRTGQFTVRELALKHGPHHATISARMKADGVSPDLTREVRQATNAALMKADVAKLVETGVQSTVDAIAAAAEVNRQVIESHRSQLFTLRDTVAGMTSELMTVTGIQLKPDVRLSDVATAANLEEGEVVALMSATSLPERVKIAEKLANTLARLIPLERQSRGLDEAKESDASFEALLDRLDKARTA